MPPFCTKLSLAIVIPATAVGCGGLLGLGDDSGPAGIVWAEARWVQAGLEVRLLGFAGCLGLERVDVEVSANSQVDVNKVLLEARAQNDRELRCFVPGTFDTTFVVSVDMDRNATMVYVASSVLAERKLFIFANRHPRDVARLVGGYVAVDTAEAEWYHLGVPRDPDPWGVVGLVDGWLGARCAHARRRSVA